MSFRAVRPYLFTALAPVAFLLVALAVIGTGALERQENLTVDFRFRLRAPNDPAADPRVILVQVDQSSLDQLHAWPWPRSVHGDLCTLLAQVNPAVVGFDVLFTEPREPAADDIHLGEGLGRLRAAVTGAMAAPDSPPPGTPPPGPADWGLTRPLPHIEGDISRLEGAVAALYPIPPVREKSLFGFVNSNPTTADGIRRHVPLVFRDGQNVFPGLSLQLLCQYWHVAPEQVQVRLGREIELPTPQGAVHIPINEAGMLLLNYRSQARFVSLSYARLAKALYEHVVNHAPMPADWPELADKILIVGQTQPGLSDLGPNPIDSQAPLVLVHLNALNNILRGDYLHAAPLLPVAAGWLLISWLTLLYVRERSIVFSVFVPASCVVLYLMASCLFFNLHSLLLPVAWPVIFFVLLHSTSTLLRWLREQQSRQQIRQVFASYIAPAVMERLLDHPENIRLGGVSQPVTMLFSDIRGFTSLSESMNGAELVTQLNEYFEKMVDCVNRHRGTLHKYIGDAVMAAWGDVVPETPEADAARAVRSALAMRAELAVLNAGWAEQKRPLFRIGIGLNHGTVTVGNIGATQRREFTLIGDPVNVAARLEGVTKEYRTDIAIGETVEALVRGEFLVRTMGLIVVKGKSRGLRVYEVLDDLKEPVGAWPAEWVARYESAMEKYLARNFTGAEQLFTTCLADRPGDYCCGLYIEFCRDFLLNPPPTDWDGTHVMKSK